MNVILLCSLICLSSSSVFNQLAPLRKIKNKSLITIAPLKKMVTKQLIDVIMDHQKDPAYLLSVLSNVDPTQLNAVIVLIKALLAASESDLAALNLASTNANTAYTDATVAYDAAVLAKAALVSAYGDANVLAEKHYTDANTVRETAYNAESVVRETAYTAESDVLDQQVNDLFVVQTEANGAKKNALGTLDTERIRLNGEIATLMQVIALLEGLGFSAPPTSSPTPATTSSPTPAAPGPWSYQDDLSDILLENKWRTKDELNQMSDDDKRNTVIVEINKMTGHSIEDLQGRSSVGDGKGSLSAIANMAAVLRNYGIRSIEELKSMQYEPQIRNTLIVETNKRFSIQIGTLQGMNDQKLLSTFLTNA